MNLWDTFFGGGFPLVGSANKMLWSQILPHWQHHRKCTGTILYKSKENESVSYWLILMFLHHENGWLMTEVREIPQIHTLKTQKQWNQNSDNYGHESIIKWKGNRRQWKWNFPSLKQQHFVSFSRSSYHSVSESKWFFTRVIS